MSLTKRVGFGVQFQYQSNPVGPVYTTLGAVVDGVDGGDAKTTIIDTAILSDKFMPKAGGQIDSGEVTFTIAYDPLDTGTAGTTNVLTGLLGSSAIQIFRILYPVIGAEAQQSDVFSGVVSGFKRTIAKDKMITAEVTITISGDAGFTGD